MSTTDERSAADTTTAPVDAPFTPAQLRILKIAVVVMGIILIAGFLGILARLFYLASRASGQAPTAASAPAFAVTPARLKPDIALTLPQGAQVRATSLAPAGDRLVVHFETPAERGIVILDLTTGEVVSRVRF